MPDWCFENKTTVIRLQNNPKNREDYTSLLLLSTSDIIRWSIVTKKTVKTDENRAILTSGDKKLYLTILEPQGAKFFTKEAETNSANEKPIHGFTLLQFEHSGERINTLKVKMSSIND